MGGFVVVELAPGTPYASVPERHSYDFLGMSGVPPFRECGKSRSVRRGGAEPGPHGIPRAARPDHSTASAMRSTWSGSVAQQ